MKKKAAAQQRPSDKQRSAVIFPLRLRSLPAPHRHVPQRDLLHVRARITAQDLNLAAQLRQDDIQALAHRCLAVRQIDNERALADPCRRPAAFSSLTVITAASSGIGSAVISI